MLRGGHPQARLIRAQRPWIKTPECTISWWRARVLSLELGLDLMRDSHMAGWRRGFTHGRQDNPSAMRHGLRGGTPFLYLFVTTDAETWFGSRVTRADIAGACGHCGQRPCLEFEFGVDPECHLDHARRMVEMAMVRIDLMMEAW